MREEIIFSRLKYLQENKKNKKNWNISWQLASFISNFIKINQPKKILEIGTSNGFSTLAISRYLNEKAKIITIEVEKTRFDEAKTNFNVCKLGHIKQILGNALIEVPKLNQK
jgi:caffeoyl-CoA O-methyltransferase